MNFWLLEDGTSYFLLEDGVSIWLLEDSGEANPFDLGPIASRQIEPPFADLSIATTDPRRTMAV